MDRLAVELLPALIAKLATTGLAELEVREGPWKVRLRRPLEVVGTGRRATDRQFRLPVGGALAGHAAGNPTPPAGRPAGPGSLAASPPGHGPAGTAGSGRDASRSSVDRALPVVVSPAVGIFRPRTGISGTRVRAGDRLGAVDVLGIGQEVVAPVDGTVGALLVEAGEGVEYGQALIEMASLSGGSADIGPAGAVAVPVGQRP